MAQHGDGDCALARTVPGANAAGCLLRPTTRRNEGGCSLIYQIDTEDVNAATGALLLYAVYRSRDKQRYKTTPDMWGQIERFTKSSAKRARTLGEFLEALKPRLCCETINPRAMQTSVTGIIRYMDRPEDDDRPSIEVAEPGEYREFLTQVLAGADHRAVLDLLYKETGYVVLLVRDRLEREKPIERNIEQQWGVA